MTYEPFEKVQRGEVQGEIVCGDCLEVMGQMPNGCVDLVVTDPPYASGPDGNLPRHLGGAWFEIASGTTIGLKVIISAQLA